MVCVCGVAGAGKTSVGRLLAERLRAAYVEGDALHPRENVDKMAAGTPLTDEDRAPWLAACGAALRAAASAAGAAVSASGPAAVLACSALKSAYRQALEAAAGEPIRFCLLDGSEATLRRRLETRAGHFAGPALLSSQLATLERGADIAMTLCIDDATPEEIADGFAAAIEAEAEAGAAAS